MNKLNEFFNGLTKSTRITIVSCGGFVAMTILILLFFVMFPITPTEGMLGGRGRLISDKNVSGTSAAITSESSLAVSATTVDKEETTTVLTTTQGVYTYTGLGGLRTGQDGVNDFNPQNTTAPSGGRNNNQSVTTAPVQQNTVPAEIPTEARTDPPADVTLPPPDPTSPPNPTDPPYPDSGET